MVNFQKDRADRKPIRLSKGTKMPMDAISKETIFYSTCQHKEASSIDSGSIFSFNLILAKRGKLDGIASRCSVHNTVVSLSGFYDIFC